MSWPPGDADPAAIPQREGQTVSLSQSLRRGTMYPSAAGDDRLPVLIPPVKTIHTVKIASCLETIHTERFNNGALLSAYVRSYPIYIKLHTKPKLCRTCIFFLWRCGPTRAMASFLRFLDHTQRRTTVGRTPLYK